MDAATITYTLVGLVVVLLTFMLSQPTNLAKWVQKKKYQYEVTFSLYMLTPTEKFVFNSIVFLLFAMILIACSVYLPRHVSFVARRAFYYYGGDASAGTEQQQLATAVTEALKATATVGDAVREAVQGTQRAAVSTAVAAAGKGEI